MPSPIFIDSNVPIYAAGRDHPLKKPCAQVLRVISDCPSAFVTSAEVLQELFHRYLSLRQWPVGREVLTEFCELMADRIEPVLAGDVQRATTLTDHKGACLSARDLLHIATMERVGATHIVSADRGFDVVSDLVRLDPADVAVWRTEVGE